MLLYRDRSRSTKHRGIDIGGVAKGITITTGKYLGGGDCSAVSVEVSVDLRSGAGRPHGEGLTPLTSDAATNDVLVASLLCCL
jgi:hypothetical protein